MTIQVSRHEFFAAGAAISSTSAVAQAAEEPAEKIIGPLVGHTDTSSTILWARFPKHGKQPRTQ